MDVNTLYFNLNVIDGLELEKKLTFQWSHVAVLEE